MDADIGVHNLGDLKVYAQAHDVDSLHHTLYVWHMSCVVALPAASQVVFKDECLKYAQWGKSHSSMHIGRRVTVMSYMVHAVPQNNDLRCIYLRNNSAPLLPEHAHSPVHRPTSRMMAHCVCD